MCLSEEPAFLWEGSQLAHFSWLPFSGQATRFSIVSHWKSPELVFSWVVLLPTHTLQLVPPPFSWQATRFNSENSQRLNWFPPPVSHGTPSCFLKVNVWNREQWSLCIWTNTIVQKRANYSRPRVCFYKNPWAKATKAITAQYEGQGALPVCNNTPSPFPVYLLGGKSGNQKHIVGGVFKSTNVAQHKS